MRPRPGLRDLLLLLSALATIAFSLVRLEEAARGVEREPLLVEGVIPATLFRAEGAPPGPVVVIAHGFSGSQTLMRSLALTFAANGLAALTFDFPGHGRHPAPLGGDLFALDGATARLVATTRAVLAETRRLGDGRVALLGHSMAGDVIVRTTALEPDIAAVVAISLFSPAVTAREPRNLLVIAGAWEGRLAAEALRLASLASAPEPPAYGVTYGRFEDGTARRAVLAPNVEHVGVLFSTTTLAEAQAWLDAAFGRRPSGPLRLAERGPALLLLLAGCILLSRQLVRLLPRLPERPAETALPWRGLAGPLAAACLLPPLLFRLLPPDFLETALLDHLAAQLFLFGLLLLALARRLRHAPRPRPPIGALLAATAGAAIALVLPLGLAVHHELTDLPPTPARLPVGTALLVGALPFFLAVELQGRGPGAARGAPVAIFAGLLLSLALAIALDRERLLFLGALAIVLVPVLATCLLLGRFARRAIGHPLPAALGAALVFAVLAGGALPLLEG